MLYILESAFDGGKAVSREAREKLTGLERIMATTAESLKALQDKLEQPAS